MAKAQMKLAKIMSTARVVVALTSFISAPVNFFVASSFCCAASARGGAAQWPPREGSAETAKVRGLSENRVFREVDFLAGLLSKSRREFGFLIFFVSVLLHVFIFS